MQGGVLAGEVKDVLLLDVTPLSLGIETLGGVMTHAHCEEHDDSERGRAKMFSTATDNQTSVEVHVLQGERPLARDNRTLGRFHLIGLPPAPRGLPQIEVTFDIDANGIVSVAAKDVATGKEQKITISSSSGLSKDEVDRLVKDAASHAAEDQARRDVIDARNQADSLAYQVEKTVAENREKVPVGDLSQIEAAVAEPRERPRRVRIWPQSRAPPRSCSAHRTSWRSSSMRQGSRGSQGSQGSRGSQGSKIGRFAGSQSSNVKDGEVVDAEYADSTT